ncbi:MAG: hypothetical protein WC449_03790 [Candidatus Paceibacterota bacterium]
MERAEQAPTNKEASKKEYIDLVVRKLPVDERVDLDEFIEIDREGVMRDKALVAQEKAGQDMKRANESEGALALKSESERFEAGVVVHIVNRHKWFGKDAHVTRASEYDDKINKTDAYLEIKIPGVGNEQDQHSTICLSIDATETSDFNEVAQKLSRNQETIKNGGQKIKYFKSFFTQERGNKGHVMPIILGADATHARDVFIRANELNILAGKMKEQPTPRVREMAQTRIMELAIHPMQRLFLEEAIMQYEYHLAQADKDPKYMSPAMREQAEKDLAALKNIHQPVSENNFQLFENDKVYKHIKELTNPYYSPRDNNVVYSK